MKKTIDFTYDQYINMLDDAQESKTIVAVVITAMGQRARKKLSDTLLGAIMVEAGNRLYAIA